jgi:hypothetical protein
MCSLGKIRKKRNRKNEKDFSKNNSEKNKDEGGILKYVGNGMPNY